MKNWPTIAHIRREYGELKLSESFLPDNPFFLFQKWFDEIMEIETSDPNAMVLSTVDENGFPDSRVVLLKGIENGAFIFYTNYNSVKGVQLAHNPNCALNFYWPHMARQVRIRGAVTKTSQSLSDDYFFSRPHDSQIGAAVSPQSSELPNREILEDAYHALAAQYKDSNIPRPPHWGGYYVAAHEIEFWQGRDGRLHDRFQYVLENNLWRFRRLAP